MNIDSYIQATRINASALCDNDRYEALWCFLNAEMSNKGFGKIPSPQLVWTPSRQCEIVTIDGHSSIIYDQTFGEDLAQLNQIVLANTGKDVAFRQCADLLFRRLAEHCLLERDFIGATYFYKHVLFFGHNDGYTVGTQNDTNQLNCHTLFQEFYILAHEYGHFFVDRNSGKYAVDLKDLGIDKAPDPNKKDDLETAMTRKLYVEDSERFVELRCDRDAYLLSTLWIRTHADFEGYSRYAVLPVIILFRHMMIMCLLNVWSATVLRVWRNLSLSPTSTEIIQKELTNKLEQAENDILLQGDLALVISRRKYMPNFLRTLSALFSEEEQNVVFNGFGPLMDKYEQRVDKMFIKVLFEFLPKHMASIGVAMKRFNNEDGLATLRSICECDQRMNAILSMVDS